MIKIAFYPLNFLIAIVSFVVAYLIVSGIAIQYVYFAGELNELGCFVISATMGFLALIASFGKIKKDEK